MLVKVAPFGVLFCFVFVVVVVVFLQSNFNGGQLENRMVNLASIFNRYLKIIQNKF